MSKLKTAQELIKTNNSSVMAGFNMFIHGLDFVNLQESSNYAFGKTFKEAISNYEKLMLGVSA